MKRNAVRVATTICIVLTTCHAFSNNGGGPANILTSASSSSHKMNLIQLQATDAATNQDEKANIRTKTTTSAITAPRKRNTSKKKQPNFNVANSAIHGADSMLQIFDGEQRGQSSRRLFFASSLFAAGVAIAPDNSAYTTAFAASPTSIAADQGSNLKYKTSPVNKRSGITVFDAEAKGYFNVKFVTYLSRFLLNFDADCQRWWYARAADLPRDASAEKINELRLRQFGAFSASVEVGLQEYEGDDGPKRLLSSLLRRYCPQGEALEQMNKGKGLGGSALEKQQREIKEARRQIALLFALLENYQPVDEITALLAAIDNASVEFIAINDGGEGYAPGYGSPLVVFPDPEGGEGFRTATGRATLKPSGRILRMDMINRGAGYKRAPSVTIAPPVNNPKGKAATAQAVLINDGINKGKIERISITDAGEGYAENESIKVTISPPDKGGVQATAEVVPELKVASITIIDGGSGYAAERALSVYVEPPPLTARVNLNDPMLEGSALIAQPLPAVATRIKPQNTSPLGVNAEEDGLMAKAVKAAKRGGGGNCVGRECYDKGVKATAYARAEMDTYQSFRNMDDSARPLNIEQAIEQRTQYSKFVSGSQSGVGSGPPKLEFLSGGKSSSSSQLLALLPSGYGLSYDKETNRYSWALAQNFESMNSDWLQGSSSLKPLDPDFGPRGRSPIEKLKNFDLSTALRFIASGAICCSVAHLILTPIDVVKTKMQIEPKKYTNVFSSFGMVLENEGFGAFFTGWVPTFAGYFAWGGAAYTIIEIVRRNLIDLLGPAAIPLEVPIIVLASSISACAGSVIICPFEAVRIRSVAQPDFADSIVGVYQRMVKDEGFKSLFAAVPVFLLKEVPFAVAKFTVFDLVSAKLYNDFPVAQEDIRLSLYVTLVSGTLGGICAAIVSNPADRTISEMKKASSDVGPIETGKKIVEEGGIPKLFEGITLRLFFYSFLVSIQFFLYDSVRLLLEIGTDDLKLYLDVLGGALTETGGPL